MKMFLALLTLILPLCVQGQTYAVRQHVLSFPDSTGIYVGDADTTVLSYTAVAPQSATKGVLVLFPPTGEPVHDALQNNQDLIALARDSGLLTIIPSINYNLYLDEPALGFINAVLRDVVRRYHPPLRKFVFGGFSLGGMNAIRYCELAFSDSGKTVIRPAAVYGVDPPLDWARMYYTFTRTLEKNFSAPAVSEAKSYLARLNTYFGGPPSEHPGPYVQRSMYSRGSPGGGNARHLKSIPVRIYSDPDIDWFLKNRHADYYDMNALDGTAFINQLQLDGNKRAEYINALGKGYRANGMRHPHSWSLVAPEDCLHWILQCIR